MACQAKTAAKRYLTGMRS